MEREKRITECKHCGREFGYFVPLAGPHQTTCVDCNPRRVRGSAAKQKLYHARWKEKHAEYYRAYNRDWRARNIEKVRERNRKCYHANKQHHIERNRAYRRREHEQQITEGI